MARSARVVVVGGGVIGCSVLWHLARKGWTDITLCERAELTAGSTWHAAGHVIEYTTNPTISALNHYGAQLYAELEDLTGQPPGYHRVGNLRIATHSDRLEEFRRYLGIAECTGVEAHLLSPEQVQAVWPFMSLDGLLGGLLNPLDGHIAPADLTQSFAIGARAMGATILRNTEVLGFTERSGGWIVHTSAGDIDCEHVVSCTGNYAMQTARMLGLPSPSMSVKHEFIVTGPVAELAQRRVEGLPELPVMRDPEEMFYVRQEGDAFVMGCYEGRGECVFTGGVPSTFGMQLFPDERDKLLPYLGKAIERVPLLDSYGIRNVVNGPQPYTPDDLPITGPAFGLDNFWLAEGNPFGITLAGGIGWQIAEWIVDGAPTVDMSPCDPQRFGDHATRNWSARKTEEAYERTYKIPKPGEELTACRPLRVSPIHDLLAAQGAVFGEIAGWERPNWFASPGVVVREEYSFHRPNYVDFVAVEHAAATASTVIVDISHRAKLRVVGANASDVLKRLVAAEPPEVGSHGLYRAVSETGTLRAEFGVFREDAETYVIDGDPPTERSLLDLFHRASRNEADVSVANLTGREGAILVSGSDVPAALARLSRADIADMAGESFDDVMFAVGSGRRVSLGYAAVRVLRTDAFGVPAWELHTLSEFLRHVFLHVRDALPDCRLIGARTLEAIRLSQRQPAWGTELTSAISMVNDAFVDERAGRRLVLVDVTGDPSSLPCGNEPLRSDERLVGATTSGGIDHSTGRPVAFAFVDDGVARDDEKVSIRLLDEWYPATVRTLQPLSTR
ncbi:MAG: FAD-dependent oxidoreductase [Ilumatobacteraceae bacterium]